MNMGMYDWKNEIDKTEFKNKMKEYYNINIDEIE